MKSSWVAIVALLSTVAISAAPSKRFAQHIEHETRENVSYAWTKRDDPAFLDKRAIIPLRINLSQKNLHGAEDKLMEVSDPDSPNYGQHLEPPEVAALVSTLSSAPFIGAAAFSFTNYIPTLVFAI